MTSSKALSFFIVLVLIVGTSQSVRAQEASPLPDSDNPSDLHSSEDILPLDPKLEEAKRRFKQGVALAKAGHCEGAISELRASYELVERTNTLFNIAHCHEELFQYTLAIQAYELFLTKAEQNDPDRVRAEATISALKNLLGTLVISSNVEAEVWLGDRKIGSAPGHVLIPGGRHVVELRASGYIPARQEISVAGQESKDLSFTLIIAQKKVTITKIKSRGLKPIYFWSGVAVTGGALLGGTYFGWRAYSEDSQARKIDPRLPRDNEKDDIKLLSNVADLFFLSAGTFAIGTTLTYFLTDWGPSDSKQKPQQALRIMPKIGQQAWLISVEGSL